MLALYGLCTLVGAALLFIVEPMAAKGLLPVLGGTAAVWTVSLAFFQTVLLAGYAYAHALARRLPLHRAAAIHATVVLIATALLPWHGLSSGSGVSPLSTGPTPPSLWVLRTLASRIGVPFFVLAATGPLLQQWFASLRARANPYPLYAVGNASSLAALLAYPWLLERYLPLGAEPAQPATSTSAQGLTQHTLWCSSFLVFAALSLACATTILVSKPLATVPSEPQRERTRPPWRQQARWICLSAAPASTMLAVTQALTTDVASVPLLWVLPLAVYLVTFILAFAIPERLPMRLLSWAIAAGVLGIAVTQQIDPAPDPRLALPLVLGTLFPIGLLCHGRLVHERPPNEDLTAFYLAIAAGGALGSLACALLAPILFRTVAEFPLTLALACLVAIRPVALAAGVTVLFAGAMAWGSTGGHDLLTTRTFFGVLRVRDEPGLRFTPTSGPHAGQEISFAMHRLYHGTTMHGAQVMRESERRLPIAYYHPSGPIGRVFAGLRDSPQRDDLLDVGIVGLGVGSLAAYAEKGEHFTFFEIDPAIVRIARDPALFTFVEDSPGTIDIVVADGRIALAAQPDGRFGLLVIDAYSSDAVPVHLLTREALALLLRKLHAGGLVAFHLSSRFFDLAPVLAAEAASLGKDGLFWFDTTLSTVDAITGKWPSYWAVVANGAGDLAAVARAGAWVSLDSQRRSDGGPWLWTDQVSSPLGVMR